MVDWGYTINKPRAIAYDANDHTWENALQEAVPVLRSCIGCGNCTATCTAGNFVPFNIRKPQTLVRRGEYAGLRKELDKCMLCGKCRLVCPRGINTRKMIVTLKRLLAQPVAAGIPVAPGAASTAGQR